MRLDLILKQSVLDAIEKDYPNLLNEEDKKKIKVFQRKEDNWNICTNAAFIVASKLRNCDRVVEGTPLEREQTRKGFESSNLSGSAI